MKEKKYREGFSMTETNHFESYSTGYFTSTSTWIYESGQRKGFITNSDFYHGYQSLKLDDYTSQYYNSFTATSSAIQCGYYKFSTIVNNGYNSIQSFFWDNTVYFNLSVNNTTYRIYYNSGWVDTGTTTTLNSWVYLCTQWTSAGYVRFYLEDHWTPFYNNYQINPPVNKMRIYNTASSSFYADYFNQNTIDETSVTIIIPDDNNTNIYIYDPILDQGDCQTEPCAKLINTPKYCYYDATSSSCAVQFQYNRNVSGGYVYLVEPGGFPPGFASWYLVHSNGGLNSNMEFPNPGYATTTYYDLFMDTPQGGYRLGTYEVEWTKYCDIGNNCPTLPNMINQSCNCNLVASSSGLFDDLRYGVECGLIKAGCYMVTPSPNSFDYVLTQMDSIKQKFPLNLYDTISSTTNAMLGATNTISVISISGMPSSLSRLNGLQLLDLGSAFNSSPVYNLVQLIRSILLFLLKIFIPLYFIMRAISLWKGTAFSGWLDEVEKQEPYSTVPKYEPTNYVPKKGLEQLRRKMRS